MVLLVYAVDSLYSQAIQFGQLSIPYRGQYSRGWTIQEDIYLVENEALHRRMPCHVHLLLSPRLLIPRSILLELD
jgi:hypothetical protein